MALLYTEEQKELIKAVHDVAESIKPHVAAADEAGKTPDELWKWGFRSGLHLVEIPEEFGGMGLDYETCAMMFEELAKGRRGLTLIRSSRTSSHSATFT